MDQILKSKNLKCKCCWNILNEDKHFIYDNAGKKINIENLLFECINRVVQEIDGIDDQAVCNSCLNQLIEISEFKMKCRNNKDDETKSEYDTDQNNKILEMDEEYLDLEYREEQEEKCNETLLPILDDRLDSNIQNIIKKLQMSKQIVVGSKKYNIKELSDQVCEIIEPLNPTYGIFRIQNSPISDTTDQILEQKPENEIDESEKEPERYENVEYLEDAISNSMEVFNYTEKLDLEMLKRNNSIEEFVDEFSCCLCGTEFNSHNSLMEHTLQNHYNDKFYSCVVDENCPKFISIIKLHEHILRSHYDVPLEDMLIQNLNEITCLTCEAKFPDKIVFGKHMCFSSMLQPYNKLECSLCTQKFTSQNRMLFHHQFHRRNQRPKICIICVKLFINENDFYNHVMFFHEKEKIYYCISCDKNFLIENNLKKHERIHSIERNYECNVCNKLFINKQTLNEHSVSHLENKPFQCHICPKTFNRGYRLRKHLISHERPTPDLIPVCCICQSVFASEEKFNEHFMKEHEHLIDESQTLRFKNFVTDKVFCCEYCESAYTQPSELLKHKIVHKNEENPFKCNICAYRCNAFSKLKTHRISHGPNYVFPVQRHYMCYFEECLRSFIHWPDLHSHLKTIHHISSTSNTCNLCNKTFRTIWSLTYHRKSVHFKKYIKCTLCNESFNTKSMLLKHKKEKHIESIKLVTKEKTSKITCNLCSKVYSNEYSYRVHHRSVHEKIVNHKCDVCFKGFYNLNDKINHMRTHTHEKPYTCSACPHKCRTASILIEHFRIHTNERPFTCPHIGCGLSFKRSYAMKNHYKLHTGEKNFICSDANCIKAYRSLAELNTHVKKKHMAHQKPLRKSDENTKSLLKLQTDSMTSENELSSTSSKINQPTNNKEGDHNFLHTSLIKDIDIDDEIILELEDDNLTNSSNIETIEFLETNSTDCVNEEHIELGDESLINLVSVGKKDILIDDTDTIDFDTQTNDLIVLNSTTVANLETSLNGVIVQIDHSKKQLLLSDGRIINL